MAMAELRVTATRPRSQVSIVCLTRSRSAEAAHPEGRTPRCDVAHRPPVRARIPRLILRHPTEFYLTAIELVTLGIVFGILYKLGSVTPAYAGLLLVALPATQAAMDFVRNLTTFLVPPRALPKLDFSEGRSESTRLNSSHVSQSRMPSSA